jgi:hypothetical protein
MSRRVTSDVARRRGSLYAGAVFVGLPAGLDGTGDVRVAEELRAKATKN